MTLVRDVSNPAFITKRTTYHPDTSIALYFQCMATYSSEEPHVMRLFFGNYLRTAVFSFVQAVESGFGNLAHPAVLIFDEHMGRMSPGISGFAVQHDITLFFLPSPMNHLLLPLDHWFFCRVKTLF
jgi:hypothetical protein